MGPKCLIILVTIQQKDYEITKNLNKKMNKG